MTSSAAEAISSATQTSVATSSRPPASSVPLQVDDGGHAGAADGHVGDTAPPRPPEGVGDDDPDVDAERVLQAGPDPPGRAVRVLGQQRRRAVRHVGQVDAGVGADEAVPGLADHEVAASAQDPHRLLLAPGPAWPRGRRGRRDQPALRLGHDLLGDDDDVTRRAARARPGRRARRRPAMSAARSVPGRHLAEPVTGRTRTPSAVRHRPPPGRGPPPARVSS